MNIKGLGTSFPEQIIFHYVATYFEDAVSRTKIDGVEADVYIPSVKCVIEVDGGYWHDAKVEVDERKNDFFNDKGLYVLRIREKDLPPLKPFRGKIILASLSLDGNSGKSRFVETIKNVLASLSDITQDNDKKTKLLHTAVTVYDLYRELPTIYSALTTGEVKHPNVLDCAGGQLWDFELNGDLNPLLVNFNECKNMKIHFVCPEENPSKRRLNPTLEPLNKWCINPEDINLDDSEERLKFEWKKKHCTLMHSCRRHCQCEKDMYLFFIENYIPIYVNIYDTARLAKGVFSYPKKIVYAILSPECPPKFIESLKCVYEYLEKPLSDSWVKTDSQRKDYEKVLGILNEEFDKKKYPDLLYKFSEGYQM